jgi:hypothetical protein
MKIISPTVHGVIDYMSVILVAMAPNVLNLPPAAANLAYFLAGSYLVVTLLTRMPLGLVRVLPFKVHGIIEFLSGLLIIASPWLFGFADNERARMFFIGLGIFVFIVFMLTDWREVPERQSTTLRGA